MCLRRSGVFFTVFVLTVLTVLLCSCGNGGGARRSAAELSDILRGNYICEISFRIGGEQELSGKGQITKNGTGVCLDILSPEPFSGMSIEYDTSGLPQSVAVHFSGMSTSLPDGALARLNPVASLFADDFASALAAVPKDSITEYEADGISGLCASLMHGDSAVNIYFAADGSVPYRLEISENDTDSEIVFDVFKAEEPSENV